MTAFRPHHTSAAGQYTVLATTDSVEVGTGISSSGASDLDLTPGGSNVVIGPTKTLHVSTIDTAGATALSIGGTNAASVSIGAVGVTTTIAGDLAVSGNETVTGSTTITTNLNVDGNTTLGNATSDTITFTGVITGNPLFQQGANHTIGILGATPGTGTAGDTLGFASNDGATGAAGVAPTAAGAGGTTNVNSGNGGAGTGTSTGGELGSDGGVGGTATIGGGTGGAGSAGTVDPGQPGNGGPVNIVAGSGGAGAGTSDNGSGADVGINAGGAGTGGSGAAGTTGNVNIGNLNAAAINLGNATDNTTITQTGSGQVTFNGNVDAALGLDVTGAALTANAGQTFSGAAMTVTVASIDLDPTGAFTLDMDATFTATITVADNLADAFLVQEGANAYIDVTTTNGAEKVEFGNATTNPGVEVLGSGLVDLANGTLDVPSGTSFLIGGAALTTANFTAPNIDTLLDGSNADALHTHSGVASTSVTMTATSGESIDAGELVGIEDSAGSPRLFKADATTASGDRKNVFGISQSTVVGAGNSVTIQLAGESSVIPDAEWDAVPGTGNVGDPVYMSETAGNWTLTAPSASGTTRQRVGYVTVGGSGLVQVVFVIGEPVDNP